MWAGCISQWYWLPYGYKSYYYNCITTDESKRMYVCVQVRVSVYIMCNPQQKIMKNKSCSHLIWLWPARDCVWNIALTLLSLCAYIDTTHWVGMMIMLTMTTTMMMMTASFVICKAFVCPDWKWYTLSLFVYTFLLISKCTHRKSLSS